MIELFQSSNAHWYFADTGLPCYEIACTSKEGMRSPSIKDALALGLVPSVTTVWGQTIKQVSIDINEKVQLITAALTYPNKNKLEGNALARMIIEDAGQWKLKAMFFGTRYHYAMECYYKGEEIEEDLIPFVETYIKFIAPYQIKPDHLENSYVSKVFGYGGKVDFIGKVLEKDAIIDYKTQGTKDGKITFYDDWGIQLGAYWNLAVENMGHNDFNIYSIAQSSTDKDLINIKCWEHAGDYFSAFTDALSIWQFRHKVRWVESEKRYVKTRK